MPMPDTNMSALLQFGLIGDFVAERYILQQKCLGKLTGSCYRNTSVQL